MEIGQRQDLSESDLKKIELMYKNIYCHKKDNSANMFDPFKAVVDWFNNL